MFNKKRKNICNKERREWKEYSRVKNTQKKCLQWTLEHWKIVIKFIHHKIWLCREWWSFKILICLSLYWYFMFGILAIWFDFFFCFALLLFLLLARIEEKWEILNSWHLLLLFCIFLSCVWLSIVVIWNEMICRDCQN